MTIIIGGHEQGLLNTSATILKRNNELGAGMLPEGDEISANVANGNLVLQESDAFLASQAEGLALARTYNSSGQLSQNHDGWRWSTEITLERHTDHFASGGQAEGFFVTYGDGSRSRFVHDPKLGYWISSDGAGAFETLKVEKPGSKGPAFVLTRADRSEYLFDASRRLTAIVDRNGVRTDYLYHGDRLVKISEAGGHVMQFAYASNQLVQVADERGNVLVRYGYADSPGLPNRLTMVTDRAGQVTHYVYNQDGTLARIELSDKPGAPTRVLQIKYRAVPVETVPGEGAGGHRDGIAVSEIVDAMGAVTSFDYAFRFADTMATDDREIRFRAPGNDNRFFVGGKTVVVDALGNARSTSNAAEYVAWRKANGYYAIYDANAAAQTPALKAQYEAIRASHCLTYGYDADGNLTEVTNQVGIKTSYGYDLNDNLTGVEIEAGASPLAASSSSTAPPNTQPARVAAATASLLAATSVVPNNLVQNVTYSYDAFGNLVQMVDGDGNKTVYTYTATNQLASETAAMGDALATRDDLVTGDGYYRAKRLTLELGLPDGPAAGLTSAQKAAIRALYTTTYDYDAQDRLITRVDPGGDRTDFQYDGVGNLIKTVAYLDATDLVTLSKQQVTSFAYDSFGNNVSTVDAEGNTTSRTFDSFGNVKTVTDPRGGVTAHTYDGDNRRTSTRDANGNLTTYTYDAIGNRVGITDANGHVYTQVYDLNNRLIGSIDTSLTSSALERRTTYQYDVLSNQTAVTDANGNTTTYTYDAANRLIDVASALVQDADGNSVVYHERYTYDALGNVLSLTDRNGSVTTYTYTAASLLNSYTDAVGNVTEYLYDADRQSVQVTLGAQLPSSQRRVLKFDYDSEDQKITDTDALGGVRRFDYDAVGNVISEINENDEATDYEYDRNNRRLKEIRPAVIDPVSKKSIRHTFVHEYDANGNEVAVTDERGVETTYAFDKGNRTVMMTDGNGIKTVWSYDSRDNVTQIAIGVNATVASDGTISVTDTTNADVRTYTYNEFNEVVAEIDGVGNALATSNAALYQQMRQRLGFATDAGLLTAAQKDALRAQYTKHVSYNKLGQTASETDRQGNLTTYAYDGLERLVSRTETLNGASVTNRYAYDGNDNLVKTTDPLGRTRKFVFDAVDRLTDQFDALNVQTHFDYDAVGNRVKTTKAVGTTDQRVSEWTYDLNDRITRYTDAVGNVESYEYDAVGNRLKVTNGRSDSTQYVYDALDRNIKVIDPLKFETRYEYDAVGNRIALIDPRGGVKSLAYDAGNRYIQTTDAAGNITRFEYDVLGTVTTQTTAFGTPQAEVTRFVYDAQGKLRQVTDAAGKITTNDYDANFNLISATDANGNVTTYGYDALNRRIRITDALGAAKSYAYDLVGNVLSETNELGNVTTYTYDAENRRLTQRDPLDKTTSFAYDAVGNRVSITDARGAKTTYAYDKNNKLTQETNALGQSTVYQYDANGNLTLQTDARDNRTTYEYDADNRVTAIVDALGGRTSYVYDANGNRTQVTDARGNHTRSSYDKNDRVTQTIDALNFVTDFEYDGNGNLVRQIKHAVANATTIGTGDQITTYGYDKLNRLVRTTDALGYARTLSYDAAGNLLSTQQGLSLTDSTAVATIRYAYDAANRRVATLSAEAYLTTFDYDAAGRQLRFNVFDDKQTATAAGGAPTTGTGAKRVTTNAYDAAGRMVSQTSALGVVTAFEYDAVGNRTAKVEASGTAQARRNVVRYDAANRVIETEEDLGEAFGLVTRFTLDAVGNRTEGREAFGAFFERLTSYQYDANNRVVQMTDALGTITRTTYDVLGNAVKKEYAVDKSEARTELFVYDARNQLIVATNALSVSTVYSNDAFGNRTRVVVSPGPEQRVNSMRYDLDNRVIAEVDGNGVETQYRYDGADNKIETIQLAAAYDAAGVAVTTYQGVAIAGQDRHTRFSYDRDNRVVSVTNPMDGITTYTYDALGNQTRIVDANGNITENSFDALGRLTRNLARGASATAVHGGVLVTHEYDVFGNIVRTQRGFADNTDVRQTTYQYDKLDRRGVITEYDRVATLTPTTVWSEAFTTSFAYDVFGNVITSAQGTYRPTAGSPGYDAAKAARARRQIVRFTYDKLDRLLSAEDFFVGNRTAYTVDSFGNRLSQTTGAGTSDARTVNFTYDKVGDVLTRTDQEGGVVTFTYDRAGNQTSKTLGAQKTTYSYDGNGRVVSETDALGTITRHTLDAFGNEVQIAQAAATTDERVTKAEFNKNNDRIADIDALGNRTSYSVDKMGNRIAETDALGRVTRLYYNALNKQIGTLDPEGYLTSFDYDAAGSVTRVDVFMNRYTAPVGGLTPPSPLAADPKRTTISEYDGAGNRIRTVRPDGISQEFLRDSVGMVTTLTTRPSTDAAMVARTADLAPRVQRFEYDGAGRMTKFTDVDGTISTYTYDTANNRISELMVPSVGLANGEADPVRLTAFNYDKNNRLKTKTTDALSGGLNLVEQFDYDVAGKPVRTTEPRGGVTVSQYDAAGRLTSVADPLGNKTQFVYDRVGNRIGVIDPVGSRTDIEYDKNDRIVKEIAPTVTAFTIAGGSVNVRPTTVTTYDAVGNVIEVTDANGAKTTNYYDKNNNRTAEINADNVLRTFTFDATGAPVSATLYMTRLAASARDAAVLPAAPTGDARTVTNEYDAGGRITRMVYPQIQVSALSATNTSSPAITTTTRAPEEQKLYDAFGQLVQSTDKNGKVSLAYYDAKGRTTATVDEVGFLTESSYDSRDNVVQQRKYRTALSISSLTPKTKPSVAITDADLVDRIYDAAGRLTSEVSPRVKINETFTGADVTTRVTTAYTYDANGNKTGRTTASATEFYYYDAANRLIGVVTAGRTLVSFSYDANGNKTGQTRYTSPVQTSIALPSAFASVLASVPKSFNRDESTNWAYDAMNRLRAEVKIMSGDGNNINRLTDYDAAGNVTRRTDPDGFQTQIGYDSLGHAVRTVTPDGVAAIVEFDAAGLKATSRAEAAVTTVPAQVLNLVATRSSSGTTLGTVFWNPAEDDTEAWVVWDTVSRTVPSATSPDTVYANRTAGLRAFPGDDLKDTIGKAGVTTTYFFRIVVRNRYGNLTWSREYRLAAGAARETVVSTSVTGSLLASSTGVATDYVLSYRYNALGQLTGSNDERGLWRTFDVDANGNVLRTRLWGTQEAETKTLAGTAGFVSIDTYAAYDERGSKVAQFDAAAPAQGQTGSVRAVTRYTYDYAGRVLSKLDPGDSVAWQYQYDGAGNVTREINPLSQATRFIYDRRGNLIKKIDARGNATILTYDLEDNLLSEQNALGFATRYGYDAFGRLTTITDALNRQERMEYDQADRQVTYTDALGSLARRYYDKRGNELWYQDANNRWVGHAYDSMSRVIREYSWQSAGPTSLTGANQAVTSADTNMVVKRTAYDVFGNVLGRIDGSGLLESFGYGLFGNMVTRRRQNGIQQGAVTLGLLHKLTYDRFGRLIDDAAFNDNDTAVTNGAVKREYDDAGRMTKITYPDTTTQYTYTLSGERATEKVNLGSTALRNQAYTYDALERLVTWTDNVSTNTLNYQYDAVGNLTQVKRVVTILATYTYDNADRVTAKFSNLAGKTYTYTYDAVGNRLSEASGTTTATFAYDAENRIVSAKDAFSTKNWQYDRVGNVLVYTDGTSFTQNEYNQSNQLRRSVAVKDGVTTITTDTLDRAGKPRFRVAEQSGQLQITYSFKYDGDGQEIQIDAQQLGSTPAVTKETYDAQGRFIGTTVGSKGFLYDGDNKIIQGGLTQYYYANGVPVGETGQSGNIFAQGEYEYVKTYGGKADTSPLHETRLSDSLPSGTQFYTATGNETLQVLAGRFYGNPDLWFVIAEANGLSGSEALKAGQRLQIPGTLQLGQVTSDAAVLYRESAIIGSKLPTVTPIPPTEDKCAQITAIILAVVIAIAAVALTILTAGLAVPALAATLGIVAGSTAAAVFGVAATVVAGAVIGFAASAATQGVLIGFGLQEEFDWKQVAIDTAIGAFTGFASALGALAQTAVKAAQLSTNLTRLARVGIALGEATLEVAGEAAQQAASNDGRIENPWMLGVAAAGPFVGEALSSLASKAIRFVKKASTVADEAPKAGGKMVKFTLPDGSVVSKPSDALTEIPSPLSTTMHANNTLFVNSTAKSKAKISLQNADEVWIAKGKVRSAKPVTFGDAVAQTATDAISPAKLDALVKFDTANAIDLHLSGQTSNLDSPSVVNLLESIDGKVVDRTISIDEATQLTAAADKHFLDDAADMIAGPKALNDAQAIEEEAQAFFRTTDLDDLGDEDEAFVRSIGVDDLEDSDDLSPLSDTFEDAGELTDAAKPVDDSFRVSDISGDDAAIEVVPADADAFDDFASDFAAKVAAKAAADRARAAPLIAEYDKILAEAIETRRWQANQSIKQRIRAEVKASRVGQRLASIPDYNQLDDATRAQARRAFRENAFKTDAGYQAALDEVRRRLVGDLKDVPPEDLVNLFRYTKEGGFASYKPLNQGLREREKARLAELAPYLRLTSTALNHFPEYQGVVYRGVNSNFPDAILKDYVPGRIVTERGFSSASKLPSVAGNFTQGPNGETGKSIFVIKGRTAREIRTMSDHAAEEEVLFRPNTRFRVVERIEAKPEELDAFTAGNTGVTFDKSLSIIFLEEIPRYV